MMALFTEVWSALCTFLVSLFPQIQSFFVTTSGDKMELTFAGICAVIMAGISLILLVFNLIRSFLPMRG
jgi:hypothetical protein